MGMITTQHLGKDAEDCNYENVANDFYSHLGKMTDIIVTYDQLKHAWWPSLHS